MTDSLLAALAALLADLDLTEDDTDSLAPLADALVDLDLDQDDEDTLNSPPRPSTSPPPFPARNPPAAAAAPR